MPFFLLTLSLVVLSQSAIFIRYAEAPAVAIGFWRIAIALPVLGLLLLYKRSFPRLRRNQWLALLACGFFLFAHFLTWFLSVQKTSVANSMILFASNPLFTALGAWVFFRERLERRHWVALLLCLTGLYCLVRESLQLSQEHLLGDALGVVCAVFFSAYVLVSKGLRRELDNIPFAFVTYSVCGLFFLAAMLALQTPFFDYSPQTWAAFSALAFGSTLLGHSLFTHCLQYFPIHILSISTLSEPMISAYSAYVLFGEPISRGGILGFFFVALGILVLYLPYLAARLQKMR